MGLGSSFLLRESVIFFMSGKSCYLVLTGNSHSTLNDVMIICAEDNLVCKLLFCFCFLMEGSKIL